MMKKAGIGRIPLWVTLAPLALGVLVWWLVWRGYAADFEAEVAAILPAGAGVSATGFPYRLETRIPDVDVAHSDAALRTRLRAAEVAVNRVPWQKDRQVLNFTRPVAELALAPLAGATVRVESKEAQASLRLDGLRIARASAVWEAPAISTGLFAAPVSAARFEAHLRETPSENGAREPRNPRLPTQAQLVLSGTDVRFGSGDPLSFALDSEITAGAPLEALSQWASGGTVELRNVTLSDATGEVARMSGTIVPTGAGALRIAGTVETVCPANVRAAIAGLPPISEKRVRKAREHFPAESWPKPATRPCRRPRCAARPCGRGHPPACFLRFAPGGRSALRPSRRRKSARCQPPSFRAASGSISSAFRRNFWPSISAR
jgi:hypothetical protein